jgi:hypothetical protein
MSDNSVSETHIIPHSRHSNTSLKTTFTCPEKNEMWQAGQRGEYLPVTRLEDLKRLLKAFDLEDLAF